MQVSPHFLEYSLAPHPKLSQDEFRSIVILRAETCKGQLGEPLREAPSVVDLVMKEGGSCVPHTRATTI